MQTMMKKRLLCVFALVLLLALMDIRPAQAGGELLEGVKALHPSITYVKSCGRWETGQENKWGFYRVVSGYIGGRDELYVQWGKINILNGTYSIVKTVSVEEMNYHYEEWTIEDIRCESSEGKTRVILTAEDFYTSEKEGKGVYYDINVILENAPGSYRFEKSVIQK